MAKAYTITSDPFFVNGNLTLTGATAGNFAQTEISLPLDSLNQEGILVHAVYWTSSDVTFATHVNAYSRIQMQCTATSKTSMVGANDANLIARREVVVIGGAAGAFPPIIGWACVTNSISLESIVLFAIIFLWTPAHFWALALFKSEDYGRAGIPMLPNVAGERTTKHQIVLYAVLTALCGVVPTVMGFAGMVYGVFAAILGAVFVWYAVQVWRMPDGDSKMVPAKKMFAYSLVYLFCIFTALMVGALVTKFTGMAV